MSAPAEPSENTGVKEKDVVATVDVTLYAIDPEGQLSPVDRTLDLYEGDTQAEVLVAALRQGPWDKDWRSALPDWFSIQSVWLDDSVCYVNLLASTVPEDADREEAGLALQALREETPLGRIGRAEEAARSIFYLASEQSAFVTGQVLTADGGFIL